MKLQRKASFCDRPYAGGNQALWEASRRKVAPEHSMHSVMKSLADATIPSTTQPLSYGDNAGQLLTVPISPYEGKVSDIISFMNKLLDSLSNTFGSSNSQVLDYGLLN